MKKLVLISLFLLFYNIVSAQVKKGKYIKDVNLEKFEGTWQGTTRQDTLIVTFTKRKVHFKDASLYIDMVLGWYKYVKKENVTENHLGNIGSSLNRANFSGVTSDNSPYSLILNFKDKFNTFSIHEASFKIIPNQPSQAVLKLNFSGSSNRERDRNKIPIPSTWHMKRIK